MKRDYEAAPSSCRSGDTCRSGDSGDYDYPIRRGGAGEAPRPSRRASTHTAKANAERVILASSETALYDWRTFAPRSGVFNFLKWLVLGVNEEKEQQPQSEEATKNNIRQLAHMLTLLREYKTRFGMPNGGSPAEQEWVLQELCKRLASNGVPVWVLEPTMTLAAQGLTGIRGVEFYLRPRNAIMAFPESTRFFRIQRGMTVFNLALYERVLVRLASFATNTRTASTIPTDDLLQQLLHRDLSERDQIEAEAQNEVNKAGDREVLAKEILDLSARGYGLFFLMDVAERMKEQEQESEKAAKAEEENGEDCAFREQQQEYQSVNSFWEVSQSTRDLFTRLATIEAAECLDAINRQPGEETMYPRYLIVIYRMISSATSSALWFSGSWQDMIITGVLAGLVALLFQTNTRLWTNKRMIFEVVVGFVVGLTAGLLSLTWPQETCFNAIAVAVMIDYLRGFLAVFSIMEVMSGQTLTGAADLIEAVVFSFLIAANILFGLYVAETIMGIDYGISGSDKDYLQCVSPIDEVWYILVVPFAGVAWAAGFRPRYADIPLMAFHAVLADGVFFGMGKVTDASFVSLFVASFSLSASAGLFSRFTGRQALADVFTGLYSLVPGIFAVKGVFHYAYYASDDEETSDFDYFFELILRAAVIGVAVWMGSLICAPTYLGTTSGQLSKDDSPVAHSVLFI